MTHYSKDIESCPCQNFPMMDAEALALSVENDDQPDPSLRPAVRALWFAKKGRWHEAHDLAQDIPGMAGSWIHAWLHREEGDYGNACYWYSRAGKPAPPADAPLAEEWLEIARELAG